MTKGISAQPLMQGTHFLILEIVHGDKAPVSGFIDGLVEPDKNKVFKLFRQMVEMGEIHNTEKFTQEEDDIYAFKSFQVRIYCFFDAGKLILLTNAVKKKQRRARPEDLKRAKNIRAAYFEAKERGEI